MELVRRSVRSNVAEVKDRLIGVRKDILVLEQKATTAATAAFKESGTQMLTGIQAMFYQNLAGRWWGPVGWLVALWARFLMAGAGVVATLRSATRFFNSGGSSPPWCATVKPAARSKRLQPVEKWRR